MYMFTIYKYVYQICWFAILGTEMPCFHASHGIFWSILEVLFSLIGDWRPWFIDVLFGISWSSDPLDILVLLLDLSGRT